MLCVNLFVLMLILMGCVDAFIKLKAEQANSSILVFGGLVLQNSAVGNTGVTVTGVSVPARTGDEQAVQLMVDKFELLYGEFSQYLYLNLLVTNPIYPAIDEHVKFVLDPGAQQFILSQSVADKLQLPKGLPCKSRFGDKPSVTGYKSFIMIQDTVPPQPIVTPPFPVGIAVCVQDTKWNLLSATFLTITDRCQCKAAGRVGLHGCANNAWI